MNKGNIILWISTAILLFGFTFQTIISKAAFDFEVKTLKDGKYVTLKGEVYYSSDNSKMVTRFTSPVEQIIITNAGGQFKSYDPQHNTIMQNEGKGYSSQYSFVYSFLSGKVQDMGLRSQGYILKNTKTEKDMIITTWLPGGDIQGLAAKVELVHEKQLPIYMCFYDTKQNPGQKVYYSSYQRVNTVMFPMVVTEFDFLSQKDSVITKRMYANPRINQQVDETYLNYIIPANAKIATAPK